MRSLLTMLGVIIGVLAVTLMGTAINGIHSGFSSSLDMLGRDVFYVERFPWMAGPDEYQKMRRRPQMKIEYGDAVNEIIVNTPDSTLDIATAMSLWMPTFTVGKNSVRQVQTMGADVKFEQINSADLAEGRFMSEYEITSAKNVTILGHEVAEALFPLGSSLGKVVRANGRKLTVIGVFESQGSFMGMESFDRNAVVPLMWLKKHHPWNWGTHLRVKVREGAEMEDAKWELTGAMRRARGQLPGQDDNFAINSSDALESSIAPALKSLTLAGFLITGLSLFVGAIGIMNITFVSVKERTCEIGTRRALGARKSSILSQFLVEAVSVCIVGGLIGLTIAYLLKMIVSHALPSFPFIFSFDLILVALFASVSVGVLSGIIPAIMASKLDPAIALRHE